jgi:hypothetical protein
LRPTTPNTRLFALRAEGNSEVDPKNWTVE